VALVLGIGDVSVYLEVPIEASGKATVDRGQHERGDSRSKYVMERGVDNKVEVVRENAHVFVFVEGRIGQFHQRQ
jgi:hypothetical protein